MQIHGRDLYCQVWLAPQWWSYKTDSLLMAPQCSNQQVLRMTEVNPLTKGFDNQEQLTETHIFPNFSNPRVHLCQTTIWCPVLWTVCCRWLCWPIDQRMWLCPLTLVWPAYVTKRIAVNTILSLSQNSLSDGKGFVPDAVLWSPSDNCKIGDKPSSKQLTSL
jgi:hypothetical protein